jgi:hypothetical protein
LRPLACSSGRRIHSRGELSRLPQAQDRARPVFERTWEWRQWLQQSPSPLKLELSRAPNRFQLPQLLGIPAMAGTSRMACGVMDSPSVWREDRAGLWGGRPMEQWGLALATSPGLFAAHCIDEWLAPFSPSPHGLSHWHHHQWVRSLAVSSKAHPSAAPRHIPEHRGVFEQGAAVTPRAQHRPCRGAFVREILG